MEDLESVFQDLTLNVLSDLSSGKEDISTLISKLTLQSKQSPDDYVLQDITIKLKNIRSSLMRKYNNDEDTVNSLVEMLANEIFKRDLEREMGMDEPPKKRRRRR